MQKWWRRLNQPMGEAFPQSQKLDAWMVARLGLFRRIATGIGVVVGALLLLAAYHVLTTPGNSPADAIGLAIAAVLVPVLMYGLWSFVIWFRRSASQGSGDPRANRRRQIVAVGVISVVAGLAFGLPNFVKGFHEGAARSHRENTGQAIHRDCAASAAQTIKAQGGDPAEAGTAARIEHYCGCVVVELQRNYQPAEIERISTLDEREIAGNPQLVAIFQGCAR